jgi:trimethylamine:corrinoid methyltransferase-like protein
MAEGGGKTEVKGQKARAKRENGEQAKAEVRTRKRSRRSEEAEARRAAQEEFSRRMTAYQLARDALIKRLEEEVKPLLADAGVSTQRYVGYLVTVRAVANVVDRLKPGTEQFEKDIEAVIASRGGEKRGYDSALLRRVADHVAKRYPELRHTLPPSPRA